MTDTLTWYLDVISDELKKAVEGKLTGNVTFQANFKEGGLCNLNCGLGRSFKKPEDKI